MTQQEVNSLLERPKPNIEAANIEVLDRLDAANKRIVELEAAVATVETEVNALPCQTCGIGSECSAHDRITRIAGAIKKANGGAKS